MVELKYPIYIPSKGRSDACITANFLLIEGIPFHIVVEPQEYDAYADRYDENSLIVLPFSNRGSVIPARNFIKEHSTTQGHARHWQLDDNIDGIYKRTGNKNIPCSAEQALSNVENFIDRYKNVAIAGLTNRAFAFSKKKPFDLNQDVYCCVLVRNDNFRWRTVNPCEDVDYSLQVLTAGYCTVLFNIYSIGKKVSSTMKGGNTPYYENDGRIKRARELERLWPGLVTLKRSFDRSSWDVAKMWHFFDTPLIKNDK